MSIALVPTRYQKRVCVCVCFRGVSGEVRLAFERSTCRKVAVKIINKKNFLSEGVSRLVSAL